MQVLENSPHADDHSKGCEQPPQPGVVRVGRKIRGMFDNQSPFGQRKAKSSQSAVPTNSVDELIRAINY